jgi:hypothetical protein
MASDKRASMKSALRKHRRLFSVWILIAFMAGWVLPQACFAAHAGMAAPATCPDCPPPADHSCCGSHCCAAIAASMVPSMAAPAQSLDKAFPTPALVLDCTYRLQPTKVSLTPLGRPPAYSPPNTINIRLCTFQE